MKHLWLILFFVAFANSQNTIAVLDFKGNGISINEASSISERLRTELFNNGDYRVVERDKLEALLEEQGLNQSGIVTDEYIVNAGSIIGVDKTLCLVFVLVILSLICTFFINTIYSDHFLS